MSSSVVPFSSCHQYFSSIRVFSNESVVCIKWPKYWSCSFIISPSNEYAGLISFRVDRFDLLAVQGTLNSLLQHYSSKASSSTKLQFYHRVPISPGCGNWISVELGFCHFSGAGWEWVNNKSRYLLNCSPSGLQELGHAGQTVDSVHVPGLKYLGAQPCLIPLLLYSTQDHSVAPTSHGSHKRCSRARLSPSPPMPLSDGAQDATLCSHTWPHCWASASPLRHGHLGTVHSQVHSGFFHLAGHSQGKETRFPSGLRFFTPLGHFCQSR